MIDRINGALLLIHPDAKPVKLGEPIRFGDDGIRQHVLFALANVRVTPLDEVLRALEGAQTGLAKID
jgi:hypothetical protein